MIDATGKRVMMGVQAGEKTSQDFQLEVQNPGGHSSRPVKNNAIYHLAGALTRIEHYDSRSSSTTATRAYFSRMASIVGGATRRRNDEGSSRIQRMRLPAPWSRKDPSWNGMLRTTCVATMLDAGTQPTRCRSVRART